MSGPQRILLVRHGETEWSASGQHTSRTDLPLVEVGREQARALAPALRNRKFTSVLSSPLKRAMETCELTGFGDVVQVREELREWDYGEYEGLTTSQIREQRPDWNLWRDGCPDGESPDQVSARAGRLLASLAEVDGEVIVFAHGHILRVLSARWLEMPVSAGARLVLSAGALCVLGHERETRALERWNETPAGLL
ncbi:MAG: histidine phosphatase family protein [Solirubrobacteraceae bacterium]